MRRIMLLRHAKSSWDHADLEDKDRPLASRGRAAAPMMGRFISQQNLQPDLVLCSSASRARQTWELVAAEWDQTDRLGMPPVEMHSSLYLATPGELLSAVRRIDDGIEAVMIVGHNPGMEQFASNLLAQGEPKDLKKMAKKFPTAALAVIQLAIEHWSSLVFGIGRLETFVRPRDLA